MTDTTSAIVTPSTPDPLLRLKRWADLHVGQLPTDDWSRGYQYAAVRVRAELTGLEIDGSVVPATHFAGLSSLPSQEQLEREILAVLDRGEWSVNEMAEHILHRWTRS